MHWDIEHFLRFLLLFSTA